MAAVFKAGDTAYIIENNRLIRKCTVIRSSGGMYLIRFENGGGIQVKGHRLYKTEEEANKSLPVPEKKSVKAQSGFRSPYDYWH